MMLPWQQLIVLAALLGVCLATDLARRKIYNVVVLPATALGIAINLAGGAGALASSLIGFAAALVLFGALFALGASAAGDVKLMAAVGAIAGWHFGLNAVILSLVINGALALVILAGRGQLGDVLWKTGYLARRLAAGKAERHVWRDMAKGRQIPFAVAAGAGCALALRLDVIGGLVAS